MVSEWKRRQEEVFVPLLYKPGDLGEVDFFEVLVDIGAERRKAWMFVLRLMYSGRDFAWLYPRQDQVCFTCALAFASDAHPERAVLFAVAQIYTLIARTRDDGERFDTGNVDIDNTGTLRKQLAKAEAELCLASHMLDRGEGAVEVLAQRAGQLDEAGQARAARPGKPSAQPAVGAGLGSGGVDIAQRFLEQVGTVEWTDWPCSGSSRRTKSRRSSRAKRARTISPERSPPDQPRSTTLDRIS
jgi:hypothetical protein